MKDIMERCTDNAGNDTKGVQLLHMSKKGISHLIFGQNTVLGILVIIQLYLFYLFLQWIGKYMPYLITISTLFSIIMVLVVINDRTDPTAKLTWMLFIMAFPLPGVMAYIFIRTDIGHRRVKKRTLALRDMVKDILSQHDDVLEILKKEDMQSYALYRYMQKNGNYPIYTNTEVKYFSSGEEKFQSMLEELERAKKYIYLEYFIIEEGVMWGKILEKLIQKASEGLDVRVMYDGTCELVLLPYFYPERLREFGIQCKVFAALTPIISTHYNNRDHRKILVIDGEVAFNGGVNLADEYINQKQKYGHWKDTGILLRGEAVKSFELMFLEMWYIYGFRRKHGVLNGNMILSDIHKDSACKVLSKGYVMPYGDSPVDGVRVGEMVYMDILNRASRYVHIMTPYLILDAELETALKFAADRGVQIQIILPGIPDKIAPYNLAKTHFLSLMEAGIEIYLYTPGFLHAKSFVADDIRAVVGTINLDYRSLYHHFECATYMYQLDCIQDIENDFQETLAKSHRVSLKDLKEDSILAKLQGVLMKAVAPLI